MAIIAVIGTLDSKGEEHAFVAKLIRQRGHQALLIDVGTGSEALFTADISRFEVADCIDLDLNELMARGDRGDCVVAMSKAAPKLLKNLQEAGRIDGVISLGGGGGTSIGTSAMRALPIGFPKLMVSTLASGNTAHYLGTKDIVMMPSIVDVAGLNSISKMIFSNAAGAICGMVETQANMVKSKACSKDTDKPLIVASMFGNTTECINIASKVLEDAGFEVLVFHATGIGGKSMESLIESGMVAGVLDLTTTEWADELVGATLSAGSTRMDAMSKAQVPAVIGPGCLDMANFGERDSVPVKFKQRKFYVHNAQVTLMRTNADECAQLGRILAQKSNANKAPTAIMLPLKGISVISIVGQPFYDAQADEALFSNICQYAQCQVEHLDEQINSPVFAKASAKKLLALIAADNQVVN